MRSTTFALLGITTAMCLGLVAIVAHQGVSLLPPAPLPGFFAEKAEVHGASVVALPTAVTRQPRAEIARSSATGHGEEAAGNPSHARVAGSHELREVSPPVALDPGAEDPVGHGGQPSPASVELPASESPPPVASPTPTPAPAPAPAPAAAPPPVAAAPQPVPAVASPSPSRGKGHSYGKSKSSGGWRDNGSGSSESPAPPPPPPAPPIEAEESNSAAGTLPQPLPEDSPTFGNGRGHRYGHSGR